MKELLKLLWDLCMAVSSLCLIVFAFIALVHDDYAKAAALGVFALIGGRAK